MGDQITVHTDEITTSPGLIAQNSQIVKNPVPDPPPGGTIAFLRACCRIYMHMAPPS